MVMGDRLGRVRAVVPVWAMVQVQVQVRVQAQVRVQVPIIEPSSTRKPCLFDSSYNIANARNHHSSDSC